MIATPIQRILSTLLMALGVGLPAYALLSNLSDVSLALAFLAADGRVGELSPGETTLLRILLLGAGVLLFLTGTFMPRLLRFIQARRRGAVRIIRRLHPQAVWTALGRLTQEHGKAYAACLIGTITFGCAIRVAHLAQPIHNDEAGAFLNWSHEPFYVPFTKYGAPGNHVLHTVLVACSYRLFGDSPIAIRLPALLAGLALLPATFLLVRRILGPWPALLALSMMAASNTAIEYSANARGYSLCALLGVWQTAAVLSAMNSGKWRAWLAATVPTALSIYTLPTMAYLPAALCVFGAVAWWRERGVRPFTLGQVAAYAVLSLALPAALYSPFVLVGGIGALTDSPFYTRLALRDWFNATPYVISRSLNFAHSGIMPACLGIPFAVIGLVRLRRIDRRWPLLWIALLATPIALSFGQRMVPMARTFGYLHPFLYALVGLGLWVTCRELLGDRLRRLAAPVAAAICVAMMASIAGRFPHAAAGFVDPVAFPDSQNAARFVSARFPQNVAVLVMDPSARPLIYQLDRLEGPGRHMGPEFHQSDPAVWVRNAQASATQAYRPWVEELTKRFLVGPVVERIGAAEIVLLHPIAPQTDFRTARAERTE